MRVQYDFPMGSEGWTRDTISDAIPDVGESVVGPDRVLYAVKLRAWQPWGTENDPSPWMRVVLQRWEDFRSSNLRFVGADDLRDWSKP